MSDTNSGSGTCYTSDQSSSSCEETEQMAITGPPAPPASKKKSKRERTTETHVVGTCAPTPSAETAPKRKRGQGKKGIQKSDVWPHYTRKKFPMYDNINGVQKLVGHTTKADCNYCMALLACDSRQGTSTLRKHIEVVCKKYPGRVMVESGQQVLTSQQDAQGESNLRMLNWSQQNCIEAITHMIVVDEFPFSQIEKPGFKHFCKVAVPLFIPPCRKVIMKNFLCMYDEKKEELRKELSTHCVSLTTDTWTSCQNINYMVITAHFIDGGWQMHKRVLAFCVIPNHQGQTIGKILESCLREWSIDKLLTISVDNASANKHAVDYMRSKMLASYTKPICGGRFMHVRCLPHIVNLIVKAGLNQMERSVTCIRNAVLYVRSSGARLEDFKRSAREANVDCQKICILDVPTRWNSTFLMLDTAVELRRAFARLYEDDPRFRNYWDEDEEEHEGEKVTDGKNKKEKSKKRVGPPSDSDWDNAATFVRFLRVFYDVTLNVSAQLKPTLHKSFHEVITIEAELEELSSLGVGPDSTEADKVLYDMAVDMKTKYDKYFGDLDNMNQLFLVALVLDPRYKLKNIGRVCETMLNMSSWQCKKKMEEVKQLVVELCDLYSQSMGAQSGQQKDALNVYDSTTSKERARDRARKASGKKAIMKEDWDRQLEENKEVVVGHEVD